MNNNSTHKGKETFISKISNFLNDALTLTTVFITVAIAVLVYNTQILPAFSVFITITTVSIILVVKQASQAVPDNVQVYLQAFIVNNKDNSIGIFKVFTETVPEVQNQKPVYIKSLTAKK